MAEPWVCGHCGRGWVTQRPCECGQGFPPGWQAQDNVLAHILSDAPPPTPLEQRPLALPSAQDMQQLLHQQQQQTVALAQELGTVKAAHAQLAQGIAGMLQPLMQWWEQQGRTVTGQDLIPLTVQALTVLVQRRAESSSGAPSIAAVNATPDSATLVHVMQRLCVAIEKLDARFSAPAEPYPSYVHTDGQIAQLEKNVTTQQQVRGEGWLP